MRTTVDQVAWCHNNPFHSIEYNISYVYHAMYAYFDRDNVGLPGFAKYFKDESDEERGHAELLMKYQVRTNCAVHDNNQNMCLL